MLCKESIPKICTAGLSWDFSIWFADLSSEPESMNLFARGPSAVTLTGIPSSESRGRWDFSAAPGETLAFLPGKYWYSIRGTTGLSTKEFSIGNFTVREDLATAEGEVDLRSPNEIALDNINAVLAGRAKVDQQRYRINNRELYRESMTELLRLQKYYAGLVRAEKQRAMGVNPFGRRIRIRLK